MERDELAQLVKEGIMPLIETGIVHQDFVNPICYRIADRILGFPGFKDEIHLTLQVPNVDFDGIELQMALNWVRQCRASVLPVYVDYEDKGRHAEKILAIIAEKYNKHLPKNVQII